MNKNEMTTRDFLTAILESKPLDTVIKGQTLEAKCKALVSAIDAKNAAKRSTPDKPSKAYLTAEPIRQAVMNCLSTKSKSITASEIATEILPMFGEEATVKTVTPKVTSALKQLVTAEKVDRLDFGRNKPLEYKIK